MYEETKSKFTRSLKQFPRNSASSRRGFMCDLKKMVSIKMTVVECYLVNFTSERTSGCFCINVIIMPCNLPVITKMALVQLVHLGSKW